MSGRELKVRYRGAVLGFFWTFLSPMMMLGVYALVFSVYFRVQMEHYAVFMFTGLLQWIFFSQALQDGVNSISDGGSLVTKSMFPLQVLPLTKVITGFANYLLSLPILLAFLAVKGVAPSLHLLAFPLVALPHLMLTTGLVLLLATADVFMRDTRHLLTNLLTLWFFLTPILYPLKMVPGPYRFLVWLNPAAILSLSYQDVFFWHRWPHWGALAALTALSLGIWALGIWVFERYKEYFAERI